MPPYDPATGQVFHQWDVPVPRIMPSSWNRASNPVNYFTDPVNVPRFRGPAPLVDMCLRASIIHIDEINKAHLQYLPTRLMGRMWKHLKRMGRPSAETWKLMVTRFTGDEEATQYICPQLMRYLTSVKKIQPLAAYIEPLVSNTFDFLAHLTITGNIRGNTPELLQLVQLKNLAVLEFIQPLDQDMLACPRLTDSILREWSRTPDPFPVLRILRVWANDNTTKHSLRYINAFPSLVLYDVAGKRCDWEKSGEPGWNSERRTWRTQLDDTLPEHFYLVEDKILDDQWELKTAVLESMVFDLSHAFQNPETKLASFPRGNYKAYHDVWKGIEGRPYELEGESYNTSSVCLRPSVSMLDESLWGFLMYCHIGRLISDRDILAQGFEMGENAFVLENIILPPRPMLHLVLADDDYDPEVNSAFVYWGDHHIGLRRAKFQTQLTFIRKDCHLAKKKASGSTTMESEAAERAPDVSSSTHRPLKKRRDISSILESFDNI